jgi:hypothetical protein
MFSLFRRVKPSPRTTSCNESHRYFDEEVDGVEASGMVATIIIGLEFSALAKDACKKELHARQKTL